MPRRPGAKLRAALALAAVLIALFLVLRTFVLGIYRVDTGSMEPTVHATPERVLVRYRDDWLPRRFELVAILRPGERDPLLKRVAVLPGESGMIRGGDLLIDGRHLPLDGRPPPVVVFDERWHELAEGFSVPEGAPALQRGDRGWKLDALASGEQPLVLSYVRKLTDDYLDARHERVAGSRSVNDALLECELAWDEVRSGAEGRFALFLTEEGDRFGLELESADGRRVRVRVTREADGQSASLAEAELDWPPGAFQALRFANVDNHLRFDLERRQVLELDYEQNTPLGGVAGSHYRDRLPRASFEARSALVSVRSIRLSRDLYFTDGGGRYATQAPVLLEQDQLFVLGDNSAGSRDSREWGPVPLSAVLGSPACVVWPPRAWRLLGPAGPQEFALSQGR